METSVHLDVDLDASDVARLKALALKLAREKKAKKTPPEIIPAEKRVYVADITPKSIMTSPDANLGMAIKGRKECERVVKDLERRYGRKFYMEEAIVLKKKTGVNELNV